MEEIKNVDLERLREEIDNIDNLLIDVIYKRLQVVQKMGKLKSKESIDILQSSRWSYVLSDRIDKAKNKGINTDFILKIYNLIHEESLQIQKNIIKNEHL